MSTMAKNNARTFRYSDEVADILKEHNNDFDALVIECFKKLPEVKKQVEIQEKRKKELIEEIQEIWNKSRNISKLKFQFELLERTILQTDEMLKNFDFEKALKKL